MQFSCHGIKDQDGELYFAMANTRLRLLGATAVAADFVNRRMTQSRSHRIVLFLDCCYAGAFDRGMRARATKAMDLEQRFGGRGRAVITASGAVEYAFEGGELTEAGDPAPSVFTTAMVRGLSTGEADRDQDGYVDLDELYDYVYDAVREVTPHQTPGKWTFGVQGDLVIARRNTAAGIAAVFLVVGGALLGAAPAVASPAQHAVDDVTGDQIVCESTTYTVISGTLKITIHEGTSASGNENVTGTLTPQAVVATDAAGNVYSIRGAFWFGGAVNAQQGTMVFTDTGKLQMVSRGSGTVDSVNVTSHVTIVNGNTITEFEADFGTCEEPE